MGKRNANEIYLDRYRPKLSEFVYDRPKENIDASWRRIGANPEQKISFFDKFAVKNKPLTFEYLPHKRTLLDTGKELAQGVAGFAGGTVDLANDIGNLFTDKQIDSDYRTAWKNAKALRTKNDDKLSYALRGIGEFVPEIVPAAGIGKGLAKGIAYGTKTASPLIKKWAAKTANFLKTPITKANVSGFAGAGAAHGALHAPDYTGKEVDVPWQYELPALLAGSAIGSSLPAASKNLFKNGKSTLASTVKHDNKEKRHLSFLDKRLAKSIDNGRIGELDSKFIDAAKKANIPLNAFNIYKNNKKPFCLAGLWKNNDYSEILPSMQAKTLASTNKILDESLVPHTGVCNKDIGAENIGKALNKTYKNRKKQTNKNFDNAISKIEDSDIINHDRTMNEAWKLKYANMNVPAKSGTSYNRLSKISSDIIDENAKFLKNTRYEFNPLQSLEDLPSKIQLQDLIKMRSAINEHAKKIPTDPKYLGKNAFQMLNLKKALDADLENALKSGAISNKRFLDDYKHAKNYHKSYLGPYKQSDLFNKVSDHPLKGEKLNVAETINKSLQTKGMHHELENLIYGMKKDYPDLANATIKDLKQMKREKLQKEIFGKEGSELDNMQNYIHKSEYDPVFLSKNDNISNQIPSVLRNDILPLIKKHKEMKRLNSKYAIDGEILSNASSHNSIPSVIGAIAGASYQPSVEGALIGAGLGAAANVGKNAYHKYKSHNLHKNMTDKTFVNELIRLGRVGKKDKQNVLNFLQSKPRNNAAYKIQIINSLNKKNEGEKWGE